jgi:hypothetical protein
MTDMLIIKEDPKLIFVVVFDTNTHFPQITTIVQSYIKFKHDGTNIIKLNIIIKENCSQNLDVPFDPFSA